MTKSGYYQGVSANEDDQGNVSKQSKKIKLNPCVLFCFVLKHIFAWVALSVSSSAELHLTSASLPKGKDQRYFFKH